MTIIKIAMALVFCLCLSIGTVAAVKIQPIEFGGNPIVVRAPNNDLWFSHSIPNNPHEHSSFPGEHPEHGSEDDYNYTCGWHDLYVVSIYSNRIWYQFDNQGSDGTCMMHNDSEVIDEPLLLSLSGTNLSCDLFPGKELKYINITISYPVRSITVEGEES